MYKILKAETLAANIHLMVVHAPRVASHCQPGQFIIVKLDEKGERIPLTICDYDREEGTVTIVFQEIGVPTPPATNTIFFFFNSSISSSTNSEGHPRGPTKSRNASPAFNSAILMVDTPISWNTIVIVPSSRS